MARTVRDKQYPAFVYAGAQLGPDVPVFFYHQVEEREFETDLVHLRRNGYRTLSCDELAASGGDGRPADGEGVVLTFDDGLSSLYQTAYPLLRRLGFRAVAYVVPAYIGHPGFVDWEQCAEMAKSGVIDIQAHSFSHSMVVTDLRIADVWFPSSDRDVPWTVPELPLQEAEIGAGAAPVLPGTPLYAAGRGFRLPRAFWEDCRSVANRVGWCRRSNRDRLLEAWADALADHRGAAECLTGERLRGMVKDDASRCRAAIEERLPGHHVRHFAYPWARHRPESWTALGESGFRTAAIALGVKEGAGPDLQGAPTEIRRVSGDFLRCLPGDGRRGLASVIVRKTARRLRRDRGNDDANG